MSDDEWVLLRDLLPVPGWSAGRVGELSAAHKPHARRLRRLHDIWSGNEPRLPRQ